MTKTPLGKGAARTKPEPAISAELIAWLESNYPDRAQGIDIPQREADARFGEVRLVRALRALHDRQLQSVLAPAKTSSVRPQA